MPDSVYCSQCGAPSTGGAAFCQRCGSRMVATSLSGPAVPASTAVATATYVGIQVMPDSYYGGFWIRLAAHLIDHAVFGVLFVPGFFIFIFPAILAAHQQGAFEREVPPPELIWPIAVFVCLAIGARMLYQILLTSSSWQGTIGKKLL